MQHANHWLEISAGTQYIALYYPCVYMHKGDEQSSRGSVPPAFVLFRLFRFPAKFLDFAESRQPSDSLGAAAH